MEKNREIKFKGFSKEHNKWAYGDILQDYTGEFSICFFVDTLIEPENNYREPVLTYVSVEKESIGQFTGLQDENGKDIYCGDVFDIGQTVNGCSKFVIVDCIGGYDVRYAFDLEYKYQYDIKELLSIEEIEIVGNIYEPTNNI